MKRKQQQKEKERKRTPYHRLNFGLNQKKKIQCRGSLNRYGFAYERRYKVNQAAKVAADIIKAATNDINNFAKKEQIKLSAR